MIKNITQFTVSIFLVFAATMAQAVPVINLVDDTVPAGAVARLSIQFNSAGVVGAMPKALKFQVTSMVNGTVLELGEPLGGVSISGSHSSYSKLGASQNTVDVVISPKAGSKNITDGEILVVPIKIANIRSFNATSTVSFPIKIDVVELSDGNIATTAQITNGYVGYVHFVVTDFDKDGIPDYKDLFPYDALRSADTDGDGIADYDDPDDDNDGILDVNDPLKNVHPFANAGTKQVVLVGEKVMLNGQRSKDIDGTIASYVWTQTSGTAAVALFGTTTADASFSAPYVPVRDLLTFQLKVTDNSGESSIASVNIEVNNPPNISPVTNAGIDATVDEGGAVTLDGTATYDPDGAIVSYQWVQVSGPAITLTGASTATPSFTAPNVLADGIATIQLTATDNSGASSVDTVLVNIIDIPLVTLAITNTNVASTGSYVWTNLATGTFFYTDRTYTHQTFPVEWTGANVLQTANADKLLTGSNVINFDVNMPVTVNVLYDNRQTALPGWLMNFTNTGLTVAADFQRFNVYSLQFPAGTVTLGGNFDSPAAGSSTNYAVVVTPDNGTVAPPVVAPSALMISNLMVYSSGSYVWDKLYNGTLFYTDRTYLHQSFPLDWTGADVLQAPNNDKLLTGANIINFDVDVPVTVYVLYDDRQTALPGWLASFTDTGIIATANFQTFNVYSKPFPAGTVTLGGNMDAPAAGASTNYVVVVKP